MKQEKRLATIKASTQESTKESIQERHPDLDWEAFKKDICGGETK